MFMDWSYRGLQEIEYGYGVCLAHTEDISLYLCLIFVAQRNRIEKSEKKVNKWSKTWLASSTELPLKVGSR